MTYEIERIYLTDERGNPVPPVQEHHIIEAETAKEAARAFIAVDGAKLLGSVCDAPGDQCTAIGSRGGCAYAITVWPMGHRPEPPVVAERRSD